MLLLEQSSWSQMTVGQKPARPGLPVVQLSQHDEKAKNESTATYRVRVSPAASSLRN